MRGSLRQSSDERTVYDQLVKLFSYKFMRFNLVKVVHRPPFDLEEALKMNSDPQYKSYWFHRRIDEYNTPEKFENKYVFHYCQKNGFGRIEDSNWVYDGSIRNYKAEGYGRKISKRLIYEGYFKDGALIEDMPYKMFRTSDGS
jgi:hypothetical protein